MVGDFLYKQEVENPYHYMTSWLMGVNGGDKLFIDHHLSLRLVIVEEIGDNWYHMDWADRPAWWYLHRL